MHDIYTNDRYTDIYTTSVKCILLYVFRYNEDWERTVTMGLFACFLIKYIILTHIKTFPHIYNVKKICNTNTK